MALSNAWGSDDSKCGEKWSVRALTRFSMPFSQAMSSKLKLSAVALADPVSCLSSLTPHFPSGSQSHTPKASTPLTISGKSCQVPDRRSQGVDHDPGSILRHCLLRHPLMPEAQSPWVASPRPRRFHSASPGAVRLDLHCSATTCEYRWLSELLTCLNCGSSKSAQRFSCIHQLRSH